MFSIITITKNNAPNLLKTYNSIINQLTVDDEYIIIDGSSNDGTVEFLQTIKDKRVKWISENDSGIYQAFNKGIRLSSKDWIGFINSGDQLYPGSLSFLRKNLPKEDAVVTGILVIYDNNGDFVYSIVSSPRFLKDRMIEHPSSFVHRNLYNRFGLFDERYIVAGDYEFFCRLYSKNVKFYQLQYPIVKFYLGGISSNSRLTIKEELKVKKIYWSYKDKNNRKFKKVLVLFLNFFKNLIDILISK